VVEKPQYKGGGGVNVGCSAIAEKIITAEHSAIGTRLK
jgi:hypothetical protein